MNGHQLNFPIILAHSILGVVYCKTTIFGPKPFLNQNYFWTTKIGPRTCWDRLDKLARLNVISICEFVNRGTAMLSRTDKLFDQLTYSDFLRTSFLLF